MIPVVAGLYLLFLASACANLAFMRRLRQPRETPPDSPTLETLIPARNEERNIGLAVSPLTADGVRTTVLDDGSTDRTGEEAERAGAIVLTISDPLPPGWNGKCRACSVLAKEATADWVVFLDADTQPGPGFADSLKRLVQELDPEVAVVTGFPAMLPGRGMEPSYLQWVPWILLATNPFWVVSRTGRGHNMFLNGQFSAWRRTVLQDLQPFDQVRDSMLEDVKIGRLLARKKIRVEVVRAQDVLSVRMYESLSEAVRGMSKNSFEIAGSPVGTLLLAALLVVVAWGWCFCGPYDLPLLSVFILSAVAVRGVTRQPLWAAFLMPLSLTGASLTLIHSLILSRRGRLEWKGRSYPGSSK